MATSEQNINSVNKRLLTVSRKLTKGDLEEMLWLCEGRIADGELENIASVLALFRKIGEMDETGNKGIAFIAELLEEIGKPNLHKELLGIGSNESDSAEKLKPLIDVKIRRKVEDMLAGEWKRFARYLHIEDHIIDQIDVDNKRVADACHESLKQWMKVEGAEATVEKLKEVLSAMPRMDVFNAIEELEGKDGTPLNHPIQECGDEENAEKTSPREASSDTGSNMKFTQHTVIQPPILPTGSKAKYNINIHPGSNVMVGDGGSMTVFSGGGSKGALQGIEKHPEIIMYAKKASLYPTFGRQQSIYSDDTFSQSHQSKMKHCMLANTYKMAPDKENVFRDEQVRTVVEVHLKERIGDMVYNANEGSVLCLELANEIKNRVKAIGYERYKIISQVTIFALQGQSVRVASRCVWDDHHDSYVSCTYRNASMCIVAVLYGVYQE